MPTRKSTSDAPTDTDGPSPQPQTQTSPVQNVQATEQQLKARAEGVSIEDYLLPRSLTLRLAKAVLPPNTAIQKDAVLAIQKAATVFVSYLASHANEATLKRTVTPADVFTALSELELEAFQPRLEKELEAFTEMKAGKRKVRKSGAGDSAEAGVGQQGAPQEDDEESAVHEAKRVKRVEDVGSSSAQAGDEEEEDEDDTQEEQEQGLENEEEIEEDEDEDEDEDEEDEDETQEEDIDRVEDLDRDSRPRRMMDPDAADETESEDESGPGTQLQSGLGLG
ncbi:DNA polymerase epsilon subunit D [Aspergillus udagawae]|uniref:DNA polymerase epsilon subunit D n=1 Tax=Aspergillus udagawae TaxID=91492 RepID=A0A8H3P383_9EURO|nr:DNA polymerase epsilon subunit D [Aspergillus udagawae]